MDEDDDFFSMRGRFRVPEKRKRLQDDDDSANSETESSSDDDKMPIKPPAAKNPLPPSKKKINIISLDSDDEDSGEDNGSTTPIRNPSLTPPPIVAPETLKQAMAVIMDHVEQNRPHTRSLNAKALPGEEPSQNELQQEDTFDMAKYLANMNSEIAKQAEQISRKEKVADDAILLLMLLPHRMGEEDLPHNWETPLGLNVRSTTTFNKMRESVQSKRQYQQNIVLAWNGVRLYHGTPKDVGMRSDERIDVYTENGWKAFQEEKKRIAQSKPEVVDLEAEVVEEVVKPVQITIFLQGPRKKLRIKVLETAGIKKMIQVYRTACNISDEKKVSISFEGDKLDENDTVKGLGLEDEEVLDVQVE